MIGKLSGRIDEIRPTELILDIQGVGYQLAIPLSTYDKIHSETDISLYVFTLHRDDQLKLFGFSTIKEKNLFTTLIEISGIGPAMALSLLSGISISRLVEAVKTENTSLLVKVPGIGKNKAEKLIFELKRKIKKLDLDEEMEGLPSAQKDSVDALISLGFDEHRVIQVVEKIIKEHTDRSIEDIIKEALKELSL